MLCHWLLIHKLLLFLRYKKFWFFSEQPQTRHLQRLGALGVNRAFSLTPFDGGVKSNSTSGEKDRTSLHFIEFHNTRYQYVFGLDCNHLKDKARIFAVLEGLMSIRKVGGHNNVFCYDFSPESMVLPWTEDSSPEIFYSTSGNTHAPLGDGVAPRTFGEKTSAITFLPDCIFCARDAIINV